MVSRVTNSERVSADRQISVKTASFQSLCLTEVPKNVVDDISKKTEQYVAKARKVEKEGDGYQHSVALLNKIVELLKTHYTNDYNDTNLIVFQSKPNNPPPHHPRNYDDRPDILALLNRVTKELKGTPGWHHLRSVGEWKPGHVISDADGGQEREYVGCTIQARPDNPSLLGITMCPTGYVLSYGSPCVYAVTDQLEYSNLEPLIRYVHSLHVPTISFSDPVRTITLDPRVGLDEAPLWHINDPTFDINGSFRLIFVGSPFSRMTTVFQDVTDDCSILKDSYPNVGHSREEDLLNRLGIDPPGWVQYKEPIKPDVKFKPLPELGFGASFTRRTRHRIFLQTTGNPFHQCETFSEAVEVTYDLLEANRWAIEKCRVLHRDISPGNLFIRPRPPSLPKDGVCFLKGVYNCDPESPSSAVLSDLDNGVQLPATHMSLKDIHGLAKDVNRELKALAGTPMYIARGPSLSIYNLSESPVFRDLFRIKPPEACELYEKAYPNNAFRRMQGKMGELDEVLYTEWQEEQEHTSQLVQRSWHDAESTILVLLIFLLRCQPKSSAPEDKTNLGDMQDMYKALRNTGIGAIFDSRDNLIKASRSGWKRLLHADLEHLAPSISDLCVPLQVDYEFLTPAQGVNHEVVLHEMLQRQLFQLYYNLKKGQLKDVQLLTTSQRPFQLDTGAQKLVAGVDSFSQHRYSSSKRKEAPENTEPASSAESQNEGQDSKRRRTQAEANSSSQPIPNASKPKIKDRMKPRQHPKCESQPPIVVSSEDETDEEVEESQVPGNPPDVPT